MLHVNTNTKSLKGFHPGKSLILSQAFITATERSRLQGGGGGWGDIKQSLLLLLIT